jgi:hypothetical protein
MTVDELLQQRRIYRQDSARITRSSPRPPREIKCSVGGRARVASELASDVGFVIVPDT